VSINTKPVVSVIITAYNREKYIFNAIDSVIASTYKDIELIVVDDCSSDRTYDISKKYENNDSRIKIYRNNRNLGQFENRNYAATLSNGKYLKFLDSDDMIYPYGLEVMVNCIERYPNAGIAISHDFLHEDEPYPIMLTPNEAYKCFFLAKGFPMSGPSAAIICKEAFDNVGGFPSPYYVGSDIILWLKIASKYNLVKMPPALNWYRRHESQEFVKGTNSFSYLKNDYPLLLNILKSPYCPLNQNEITRAMLKLKQRHCRNIFNLAIKLREPRVAKNIFKESRLTLWDIIGSLFSIKI